MAKGSQDWVQRTDAFLQSVAQIITRNTYGGVRGTFVSGVVAASTATTILSLSGKGVIRGVYFRVSSTATLDNDFIDGTADGQSWQLPKFGDFRDYNWDRGAGVRGVVTLSNDTDFIVAGASGDGDTFESSYVIRYNETYGRTPTAYLNAAYALVS